MKIIPLENRFWNHVKKTSSCWFWTGTRTVSGYGVVHDRRKISKKTGAHIISWELSHGPVPNGLCVCHSCDVRDCVRPSHLFLGTQADNIHDMDSKERRVRKGPLGEKNSHARLDQRTVLLIRRLYSEGMKEKEIVLRFRVHQVTINHILNRRTWKHV